MTIFHVRLIRWESSHTLHPLCCVFLYLQLNNADQLLLDAHLFFKKKVIIDFYVVNNFVL